MERFTGTTSGTVNHTMIDRILNRLEQPGCSSYDFRKTACPKDTCINTWDLWVPYYQMKRAIAAQIYPESILEIGVRYGYSAMAFLDACRDAEYIGWDIDDDKFGGEKNAYLFATGALRGLGYNAEILIQDSQRVHTLDRDFDLVHIDGQQDYVGTLHDLELTYKHAKYILVDGYHWNPDNWRACQEWLYIRAGEYRWAGLIPGYAGELLISMI